MSSNLSGGVLAVRNDQIDDNLMTALQMELGVRDRVRDVLTGAVF